MNALDVQLKSLVDCLSSQKINYIIFGGVAVSVYGEPRFTADIDVNILLEKRKIGEFLKKAKKYGFSPALVNIKEMARKCGVIPLNLKKGEITGKFDIIIAENPMEYAAIERGIVRKIGSMKVRFISPEDLVIYKITSPRPRDLEDLKGILFRRKGKLDLAYIRFWLKKIDKIDNELNLCRLFNNLLRGC